MAAPQSTLRRRLLGRELRRLRESAGLTLVKAAALIDRTDGALSRIENGYHAIRPIDVRNLVGAYGNVEEARCEALITLARNARERGWWQRYADLLMPSYLDFIGVEADAAHVRAYQTEVVYGLLQTRDYARSVTAAALLDASSEEVETLVEIRMARQAVLQREHPLKVSLVVKASALETAVGGRDVMGPQLAHLAEVSRLPNVTVQVLPQDAGAHIGMWGPFVTLTFPEPAPIDVVVLDSMTSILYLEEDDEVSLYLRAFEHLQDLALPPEASREMITRLSNTV